MNLSVEQRSGKVVTPAKLLAEMHNRRSKLRAELSVSCWILVCLIMLAVVRIHEVNQTTMISDSHRDVWDSLNRKKTVTDHTAKEKGFESFGPSDGELIPLLHGW